MYPRSELQSREARISEARERYFNRAQFRAKQFFNQITKEWEKVK